MSRREDYRRHLSDLRELVSLQRTRKLYVKGRTKPGNRKSFGEEVNLAADKPNA